MWLNLALPLVYPGIPVAGISFYADDTGSPGNNLKADGDARAPESLPPLRDRSRVPHRFAVILYNDAYIFRKGLMGSISQNPSAIGQSRPLSSLRISRIRLAHLGILALLPLLLALLNDYWAFTTSQSAMIDPWLYTSYFLHLKS